MKFSFNVLEISFRSITLINPQMYIVLRMKLCTWTKKMCDVKNSLADSVSDSVELLCASNRLWIHLNNFISLGIANRLLSTIQYIFIHTYSL